jgi:hypothetical protein
MNILTDEEMMAIDPDGFREGFARQIEAKIMERIGEPVPSPDKGPWQVDLWPDGRLVLQSDDFEHDVALVVTGDFYDNKRDYAEKLAAWMNSKLFAIKGVE